VYLDAMRDRERVRAAFDAIFRDVDAIFTYTLPWEPHPIVGEFTPVNPTRGFTGMVAASNLADLPALFLPVGLTANQLPVGVQLVGPKFSEAMLVALGEQFQAATRFHALRPPTPEAQAEPALAGA
jgi:aspartyl-tRNA(Asn)/glutamyl-tRNA(Gln) amidotransferase subunit A